MPQQLYWVREKESGQAFQMHSVDANEGLALGDYELILEPEKELKPEDRAAARSGFGSPGAFPHPELQTPEQRTETRRRVKEEADNAAQFISGPLGTPMVIPAGQSAPAARAPAAAPEHATRAPARPATPRE
jgi:hypothetical protein